MLIDQPCVAIRPVRFDVRSGRLLEVRNLCLRGVVADRGDANPAVPRVIFRVRVERDARAVVRPGRAPGLKLDRKSTRLNSSHGYISYAVFCLKKKNNTE